MYEQILVQTSGLHWVTRQLRQLMVICFNSFIHKTTEHIHLLPLQTKAQLHILSISPNFDMQDQTSAQIRMAVYHVLSCLHTGLAVFYLFMCCCSFKASTWSTVHPFPAPSANLLKFNQWDNTLAKSPCSQEEASTKRKLSIILK